MACSLGLLVVIAHILCVRGDYNPGTYSRSENAVRNNPKWMQHLCDDLAINKVSIPGTSHSMTYVLNAQPDGFVGTKTQSMSLRAQLDSGIRFVDIHPKMGGSLSPPNIWLAIDGDITSGGLLKFTDYVLDVIIDFLKTNPTEFVMMRMKPTLQKDSILHLIQPVYTDSKYEPYLYVNDQDIPTVGQVRGKIVPIRAHPGSGLC